MTLTLSASQVMPKCFLYFLGCQKLKQELTSPFLHTFIRDFFFFQVPIPGPAAFLDVDVSARESFHMSKSI